MNKLLLLISLCLINLQNIKAQWKPDNRDDKILEYSLDYNKAIDSLEFTVKIQANGAPINRDSLEIRKSDNNQIVDTYYCVGAGAAIWNYTDVIHLTLNIPREFQLRYYYRICEKQSIEGNDLVDSLWLNVIVFEDSTVQFNPVSVSEINEFKELNVYPNPVTNFIEYNLSANTTSQNIKLEIFNLEGQLIKSFEQKANKDKIDLENLKSGTYTLKISEKNQVLATRKFLKE